MLPKFLIIGAMKAGSTTLYRDLLTNPAIFLPEDKEPNSLLSDKVLSRGGLARYERLFAPAADDQTCGEASTSYSKLPDYSGAPERAMKVIGPELRLIYLAREPVARIVSQHHHQHHGGVLDEPDVNVAVREFSPLLDWSRYAMQAEVWIDVFGRDALRIVPFEEYVADRRPVIASLSEFLGITPMPDLVEVDRVFNKSTTKPVASRWGRLRTNPIYRTVVRPLMSSSARDKILRAIFPTAPDHGPKPTTDTINFIYDELADDLQRLQTLLNRDQPLWDREKVLAKAVQSQT